MGGMTRTATMTEAINAYVFVNANGRKSFPSAPIIVNTGRKLTTVVATAVTTAPPTSRVARNTVSKDRSPGGARLR